MKTFQAHRACNNVSTRIKQLLNVFGSNLWKTANVENVSWFDIRLASIKMKQYLESPQHVDDVQRNN